MVLSQVIHPIVEEVKVTSWVNPESLITWGSTDNNKILEDIVIEQEIGFKHVSCRSITIMTPVSYEQSRIKIIRYYFYP